MLNDTRVASACLYVRTYQRVRNSKNIATIRDFQVHVRVNSTRILFDKYLDHMLVKFEQNRMVRTVQHFELFDKKWLTIFDKVLTPFW